MNKIIFAAPHHFTSAIKVGGYQYAKVFGNNGWEVSYFSNLLSPFNVLFDSDKKSILERVKIYLAGGGKLGNVWYYVPFTLIPHHNNVILLNKKFFLDNYYRFTVPPIGNILNKKRITCVDILWIDFSNQAFWMKIINYNKLIYRVSDNIAGFKGKNSEALMSAHKEIMGQADIILMTSKLLMNTNENMKYREKMLYCPNGVDLSNFRLDNYPIPEEFLEAKDKNRGIALYVGAVDEWFDFELTRDIANKYPEINFFIVGPVNLKLNNFFCDNVFFLGRRNYQQIPSYINHCTFGIIPFKINDELVKYINPIKMYEFLSLGKPVISTAWDELKIINPPIYLAHSKDEFIAHIEDIKVNGCKFKDEELICYANNNTWEARYALLNNHFLTNN